MSMESVISNPSAMAQGRLRLTIFDLRSLDHGIPFFLNHYSLIDTGAELVEALAIHVERAQLNCIIISPV